MSRRGLWWLAGGCGVVLVAAMAAAVALNRREAHGFDEHGVHTAARVTDKHTWTERRGKTDDTHYCMNFAFTTTAGSAATSSACDHGIDQIYDHTKIGDTVRIVYLPDLEVMLEDWATGKLGSF